MNTITIELCAEDRARLDNIIEALRGQAGGCSCTKVEAPEQTAPAAAPEEPAPEEPEPATELPFDPEPAAAPKEHAAQEVTTAELQSKVVQLVSAGKKEETRAIVKAYAESVGQIPADKRAEVMAKLNALEV